MLSSPSWNQFQGTLLCRGCKMKISRFEAAARAILHWLKEGMTVLQNVQRKLVALADIEHTPCSGASTGGIYH